MNPFQSKDMLSSKRFGRNYYAKLRDLLEAQAWKAANQETASRMCMVMNHQPEEKLLPLEEMKHFPRLDLSNINSLWLQYSQYRFGFSVQAKIWQSYGSPFIEEVEDWEKFGVAVGWRKKRFIGVLDTWLDDSQLTFDLSAPTGHLPAKPAGWMLAKRVQRGDIRYWHVNAPLFFCLFSRFNL